MNESRIENSFRNTFWGTINKLISLAFPFIIRTIILKTLGSEYLGLSGLFSSILQLLSFAELGFGSAIVFSMYKPIAENDTDMVCALLKLYKGYYRIVGFTMFIIGFMMMPFIKFFISGTYPDDINLYILYAIYLFNSVISYLLFAYKISLFSANQREDIISNINSFVSTISYIIQIIILLKFKDYYIYILILPIATILTNIINAYISKRTYPHYICRGELNNNTVKKINRKVIALIGHRMEGLIILSADNIVISAFLGLTMLASYNNYYYIIAMLTSFYMMFFNSIRPSIGNSMVKESLDKNYTDFKKMIFLTAWIIGWCSVCLICLYQDFMMLWVGKEYLFPISTVILLTIYFYEWKMIDVIVLYRDAAGMWSMDKFRPYITATLNVILNIILVQKIGVNGVILSTFLIQLFISYPWVVYLFFKNYFKRTPKEYIKRMFTLSVVVLAECIITYFVCSQIKGTGLSIFFIKSFICLIFPNVIWLILFHKTKEFNEVIEMVKVIFFKRRKNYMK